MATDTAVGLPHGDADRRPGRVRGLRAGHRAHRPGRTRCLRSHLHPWSIYRIDKRAGHIGMLLDHADGVLDIRSCGQLYEQVRDDPQLAAGRPQVPLAG